ncbi:MAG: bifunctional diaminohydroxyphosphoribosylaminopyrimidine deaminase/5-amino-6-(5-phosphoribosylamino)uracil reductase RibD [Candidatus Marinimicrobia bacterium]|nr:bifunctional diaminohydroxyphosphoribosylaminopyrimidine deaminase/5-amino-6-(5-phosphoribosylamino)uracil reductase RibD [Candidatus Neomarinimicrobiota bacterium]
MNVKKSVECLMREAIELAKSGVNHVSPNPYTGALVVRDERVIGRGRHEKYGEAHAEVNAIRDAGGNVEDCELFVTLEPCSHYGKTPPCTDLIIQSKISKVYIGMQDPNPLVAGDGIQKLRNAGIIVEMDILHDECANLNQPFIKMMTSGLPYIIAKAAITIDGFMADKSGCSKWISSTESRKTVHEMRAKSDAVMVGMGTVLADNPELTVRNADGMNSARIVYDPRGNISMDTKLVQTAKNIPLYLIAGPDLPKQQEILLQNEGVHIVYCETKGLNCLQEGLKLIGKQGIQSILVEGGGKLHTFLAQEDLIDKLELFIAPKMLGDGVSMMKIPPVLMPDSDRFINYKWKHSGSDMQFTGIIKKY